MKKAIIIIPAAFDTKMNSIRYLHTMVEHAIEINYNPFCIYSIEVLLSEILRDLVMKTIVAADAVMFNDDVAEQKTIDEISLVCKLCNRDIIKTHLELKYRASLEDIYLRIILEEVAGKKGFSPSQLSMNTRKREIVDLRYVYFRRAKEQTDASLSSIGRPVGRDHATVMHGLNEAYNTKQIKELYESIYGQTKIKASPVAANNSNCTDAAQEARSILPYSKMEEGERFISEGESIMPQMRRERACSTIGGH